MTSARGAYSRLPAADLVEHPGPLVTLSTVVGSQGVALLPLANVSGADVAYKVKTTAPQRYCVRPNADVLPVGTSIDVELVLQAQDAVPPDSRDACKDKFQLLVAPVPPHFFDGPDPPPPARVWDAIAAADTRQVKFKVFLDVAPAPAAAYLSSSLVSASPATPAADPATPPDPPLLSRLVSAPAYDPLPAPALDDLETESEPPSSDAAPAALGAAAAALGAAAGTVAGAIGGAAAALSTASSPATSPDRGATGGHAALTETAGGGIYATAAPDDAEIEAARARVLGASPAPAVRLGELSDAEVQRAAVERAGMLARLCASRDRELDAVAAELTEANHRLADAKMAVLPAYDVKYEVDEDARISPAQLLVMAAISCVMLTFLV